MSDSITDYVAQDLPEYKIHSLLGTGSTATVYKATQNSIGRDVAVKRFSHEAMSANSDLLVRFQREAAIWAHLNHDNLIHLYDYRATADAQYIILEYCHGMSLREVLDKSIVIPAITAASIIYQVLDALIYLHSNGIVHRDLKPANIFIRHDGTIKLMDFGISASEDFAPLTNPGSIMGTPAYMSPEQATGKKVDHKSDIFSCGILGYEMLEGKKPFISNTLADLINEIDKGKYEKVTLRHPRALRHLIHKSMQRNMTRRFNNAFEMKHIVQDYLNKHQVFQAKEHLKGFLRKKNLVRQEKLFPKELEKKMQESPLAKAYQGLGQKKPQASFNFDYIWLAIAVLFLASVIGFAYKNIDAKSLSNIKQSINNLR